MVDSFACTEPWHVRSYTLMKGPATTVRSLAAVVAAACLLALAAPASAAPLQLVTGKGVAGMHLGTSAKSLREAGKIGPLGPGCELDPGQKVAQLQPPLHGTAVFRANRRLSGLDFSGGVKTARGIRVGSTAGKARTAYPNSFYQPPGSADPFAEGFLWVNSIEHPKLTFTIDPSSRRVETISVHAPNFCE
jgi:hypothetical protein